MAVALVVLVVLVVLEHDGKGGEHESMRAREHVSMRLLDIRA